jgi:hypothetical protein
MQVPSQHVPSQQLWFPTQQKPPQQVPLTPMQVKPSVRETHSPSAQTWQEGVVPHVCPFLAALSQAKCTHVPHSGQPPSSQQAAPARQAPSQQSPPGHSELSALATHCPSAQTWQLDPPQSFPSLLGSGVHAPSTHVSHSAGHSASLQQASAATQRLSGQQRSPLVHCDLQA